MVKSRTNVSIDPFLLEKARASNINLSAELEKVLINKEVSKKDLPDQALIVKCSLCNKEITEGFLCRERKLVLCQECQDNCRMADCPHDKDGVHMHIKWPGFGNKNIQYTSEVKAISGVKNGI